MKLLTTIVLASMLTACASTMQPSAINNVNTVEIPVMPAPPAALLTVPVKPKALQSGKIPALLNHAVDMGVYIGELENQNAAWRAWATGGKYE